MCDDPRSEKGEGVCRKRVCTFSKLFLGSRLSDVIHVTTCVLCLSLSPQPLLVVCPGRSSTRPPAQSAVNAYIYEPRIYMPSYIYAFA